MARKKQKQTSLLASLPQELRLSLTAVKSAARTEDEVEAEPQRDEPDERPAKRRKLDTILPLSYEKYDATGLVPFYANANQVPNHLKKYFAQRYRLFSRYSEGCLLDEEGWYSVTPERIADQIAERCRCDTIIDAFCGVGGNAIAFAKTCERVIAIDNSPVKLALARHNAALYGVVDRIDFVLADFVQFAKALSSSTGRKRKIDVVFLSPPWGGVNYQSLSPSKSTPNLDSAGSHITNNGLAFIQDNDAEEDWVQSNEYGLANLKPLHGKELFNLARRITPHVAFFLPRNQDLQEVSDLVTMGQNGASETEKIEVEEEWMGNKLKALTCYFGGLAEGQDHLWP